MEKLKPYILNPEIYEHRICRSLKNQTHVGRKATLNVKALFIMNHNDLCKNLDCVLNSVLGFMP